MVDLKDIENMIEHDLKGYERKDVLLKFLSKQQSKIDQLKFEIYREQEKRLRYVTKKE